MLEVFQGYHTFRCDLEEVTVSETSGALLMSTIQVRYSVGIHRGCSRILVALVRSDAKTRGDEGGEKSNIR